MFKTARLSAGQLKRPSVPVTIRPTKADVVVARSIAATLRRLPEDASARGLAEGDGVRIFNDLGEVHSTLTVLPTIRPGTVSLPKGIWRRSTRNGYTGTSLVPDTLTDIGEGACFNDARVQVASLATA